MSIALFLIISLFIIGLGFGNVRISPPYYNFGLITLDNTASYPIEFKNVGNSVVHVCNIKLLSNDNTSFEIFKDNCKGKSLSPTSACVVEVLFKPHFKKKYTAILSFFYDDNGNSKICDVLKKSDVKIEGGGTSLKIVKVFPEPVIQGLYFEFPPTSYGETRRMIFRICNAGGDTVILKYPAVEIENLNTAAFGIPFSTCDNAYLVYHPNNEKCDFNYCEFEVVFDPASDIDISRDRVSALIHINDENAGPGGMPANLKLYINGRITLGNKEALYAPVGGTAFKTIHVSFTCPDNGNDTPGETIELGNTVYSISGAYFSVDEKSSYCPPSCTEGTTVQCTIALVFKPEAPGIYEGRITISTPTGIVTEEKVIGLSGSFTGNFLVFSPSKIKFQNTTGFHIYSQVIEVRNTQDGRIPVDFYTTGNGFSIYRVNCSCNEGYYYDGRFCIPDTDSKPVESQPYVIKPGEACSVEVAFFKPLTLSSNRYTGKLIVSTPIKVFSIPLESTTNTPSEAPSGVNPPDIDLGGGGNGCNVINQYTPSLLVLLLIVLRRIKKLIEV